jgi:hypothetical protein
MRLPLRLAALPLLLTATLTAPAQDAPLPGLYGTIKNGQYTAPGGLYRVSVPVLPEFGGRVRDTENVVTFDDDISTHASIACFRQDLSQRWEYDTRGAKDYLIYFYTEFVLPDFRRRYPQASNEASAFSPEFKGGALFVYTLLPGGSLFEGKAALLDKPVNGPAVAKRGNLLFVQDGHIFILTMELAERVTQRSAFQKTPEEENEILRTRLLELTNRMTIPAPKSAAPKTP